MECPRSGIIPKLTFIKSFYISSLRAVIVRKIVVSDIKIKNDREGSMMCLMTVVSVNASSSKGERSIFWRSGFVGRCSIWNKNFFPQDKFFPTEFSKKELPNYICENDSSEACQENTNN